MFKSNNSIPHRFAFIGGASSTILSLAYLTRGLKNETTLADTPIEIFIFDAEGLNPGPAYRYGNPYFSLNQPAGQEMDPFWEGGNGLPCSFIDWVNGDCPDQKFAADDFVHRGLFGNYLRSVAGWVERELSTLPHIKLTVIQQNVAAINSATNNNANQKYIVQTEQGHTHIVESFILATGHTYHPRYHHSHYIPAYATIDFEERLAQIAQGPRDILFIGSGASMADIVCALEQQGCKKNYFVLSPYGNTGWIYRPSQQPTPQPEQIITDEIGKLIVHIADLHINPIEAVRLTLINLSNQAIAPQFFLAAALKDERLQEHQLHKVRQTVKAFYGNPLSPERFEILERLQHQGRLIYQTGFVTQSSLPIFCSTHTVIDCAVTGKGIRDARGEIAHPLIRQLLDSNLITTSATGQELDIAPADGRAIWAVGPITNASRNGIETFLPAYRAVADNILNELRFRSLAPQRASQIYQQHIQP